LNRRDRPRSRRSRKYRHKGVAMPLAVKALFFDVFGTLVD